MSFYQRRAANRTPSLRKAHTDLDEFKRDVDSFHVDPSFRRGGTASPPTSASKKQLFNPKTDDPIAFLATQKRPVLISADEGLASQPLISPPAPPTPPTLPTPPIRGRTQPAQPLQQQQQQQQQQPPTQPLSSLPPLLSRTRKPPIGRSVTLEYPVAARALKELAGAGAAGAGHNRSRRASRASDVGPYQPDNRVEPEEPSSPKLVSRRPASMTHRRNGSGGGGVGTPSAGAGAGSGAGAVRKKPLDLDETDNFSRDTITPLPSTTTVATTAAINNNNNLVTGPTMSSPARVTRKLFDPNAGNGAGAFREISTRSTRVSGEFSRAAINPSTVPCTITSVRDEDYTTGPSDRILSSSPPPVTNTNNNNRRQSSVAPTPKEPSASVTTADPAKEAHKRAIKALQKDILIMEKQISETASATRSRGVVWDDDSEDAPARRRQRAGTSGRRYSLATVDDLEDGVTYLDFNALNTAGSPYGFDAARASDQWADKIEQHIRLATLYAELITLDYAHAEKKNLENLCWKKAVYPLVEEFRSSLKHVADPASEQEGDDGASGGVTPGGRRFSTAAPVTLPPRMSPARQAEMETIKTQFAGFLDAADAFYDGLMERLREMDMTEANEKGEATVASAGGGGGSGRRMKWYKCIAPRGDLARYRWTFVAGEGVGVGKEEIFRSPSDDEDDSNDKDEGGRAKTAVSARELARREAQRWYSMGIRLMPANAKMYFHLSLLLGPGEEFAKLYFCVRSLVVRRNGFLNAREGLVVLFEANRRKVEALLSSTGGKGEKRTKREKEGKGGRRRGEKKKDKEEKAGKKNRDGKKGTIDEVARVPVEDVPNVEEQEQEETREDLASALLVRLHGMLFTKIGLDQFAGGENGGMLDRFLNAVFRRSAWSRRGADDCGSRKTGGGYLEDEDGEEGATTIQNEDDQFWFHTAVVNLAALYGYDYPSSRLARLSGAVFRKQRDCAASTLASVSTTADEDSKSSSAAGVPGQARYDIDTLVAGLADDPVFGPAARLLVELLVGVMRNYLDAVDVGPAGLLSSASSDGEDGSADEGAEKAMWKGPASKNAKQKAAKNAKVNGEGWIIYIEVVMQWMVASGVCVRERKGDADDVEEAGDAGLENRKRSVWEQLVCKIFSNKTGDVGGLHAAIGSAAPNDLWPLLARLLTDLLRRLPDEERYELVDRFLLNEGDDEETEEEGSKNELLALKLVAPALPEEYEMRGLGWAEEVFVRSQGLFERGKEQGGKVMKGQEGVEMRRKMRIVESGFLLIKQLKGLIEYDPVEEAFFAVESTFAPLTFTKATIATQDENNKITDTSASLSSTEEEDEEEDTVEDESIKELKLRRQQLKSLLSEARNSTSAPSRKANRKGNNGAKKNDRALQSGRFADRTLGEDLLNERIMPGYTTLVIDTNCFIGYLDAVKEVIECGKWVVVVPLVVVTELDGLRNNPPPLGSAATEALAFLDLVLKRNATGTTTKLRNVRIQTSHNNFLPDITIRSEQFGFGEMDKNLDDLVLGACLWWEEQKKAAPVSAAGKKVGGSSSEEEDRMPNDDTPTKAVKVCLVTGDRNLRVKARARNVEVVGVGGVKRLVGR